MKKKLFDIGGAVEALKKGHKISRKLWKGDALKGIKHIALANKNKSIWVYIGENCPGFHWNHEHHDLLATDYFIVE